MRLSLQGLAASKILLGGTKRCNHGVRQIISTFEILNSKIKAKAEDYEGIIVSSSVPAATHQKFRKLQEKYYRGKKLLIRKTHIEHVEPV